MTAPGARRVAWLTLWLAACGGDAAVAPVSYTLVATGRAERGLVVRVGLRRGGDAAMVAATGLTVSPADAATVSGNGDVLLTRAGSLTIRGATPEGAVLSLSIDAAVPPAIVFDGRTAGNRDVYRVALDGAELIRLTTSVADDVHPTATGTVVLFTSFRDGNAELYMVSPDGTGERRLTQTTSSEGDAALSPDGRRVAYATNAGGASRVWIGAMDVSSASPVSAVAPLSAAAFGGAFTTEATPAWAPSSDRLLLTATATPSGGAGLFTATATAGTVPTLVAGSGTQVVEVEPAWSADGFRIAYAAQVSGTTEIFLRDLRTSAVTQLTRGTGSSGQPSWLPDGRVVFTTFTGATSAMRWVDPALPLELHTIAVGGLSAEHAAPVRP